MSSGHVATPASIRGAIDPARANYFCGSCRSFVQAPQGAAGMRECPDPGMHETDLVWGFREDAETARIAKV